MQKDLVKVQRDLSSWRTASILGTVPHQEDAEGGGGVGGIKEGTGSMSTDISRCRKTLKLKAIQCERQYRNAGSDEQ